MSERGSSEMIDRAIAASQRGDFDRARSDFAAAAAARPRDAGLLNTAGAFHAKIAETEAGLAYFYRAVAADPGHGEAIVNVAVMLSRLERHGEAADWLAARHQHCQDNPKYWSARAAAERSSGRMAAAAMSYDRCLAVDPNHPRALHGRARVALERGEDDMVERFEVALAVSQGDAELWLGIAQALEYQGKTDAATDIAKSLCRQAPHWTEALELLAQLRWNGGDHESFTDHFEAASAAHHDVAEICLSRAQLLAGIERFAEAADVAARAAKAFPDDPQFVLREAVHAGEAGDDDRAERLFASLKLDSLERKLHEARHWLRREDAARAEHLLASVIEEDRDHIGGWALRDIAWRMMDDSRSDWLHGQAGLIEMLDLALDDHSHRELIATLDRLHDGAAVPLGQSVRDGTQTRGGLLDRHEEIFGRLRDALRLAVERYRRQLPAFDEAHPLLRHRDDPLAIVGSWSIRLARNGYHTGHIHPQGLLSSAAYMVVPDPVGGQDDPQAGWLELGRPPVDLRLTLPPRETIQPRTGKLALFPSTLYHGTRKFDVGRRLSIAFDVALDKP